jgi:integrase
MKPKKRRGVWVLDFYDQNGRRRTPSFGRGDAGRERAKAAAAEIGRKLQQGTYVAPSDLPTFRKTAEEWFGGKAAHRPASRAQWRMHLDRHLLPEIGDLRLDRLTVDRVALLRDDLAHLPRTGATRPLGPKSVNKVLTTGSAIFTLALRKGILDRNPFALVERLRENAAELSADNVTPATDGPITATDVFSADEMRRALDAASPGRDRTLILTGYLTGARPNELLALRWSDLELPPGSDTATVSIRRAFTWARVRGEEAPVSARLFRPKTKAGLRTIEIPSELVVTLRAWKLQCPPSPEGLVFPADDGTPLHRSTALKRGFYPALRRAGLRQLGMMALRHSHASALLLAGAPITYVQHRLGHANPAVTLRVYSHWIAGAKTTALTDLTRALTTPAMPKETRTA